MLFIHSFLRLLQKDGLFGEGRPYPEGREVLMPGGRYAGANCECRALCDSLQAAWDRSPGLVLEGMDWLEGLLGDSVMSRSNLVPKQSPVSLKQNVRGTP